MNPSLSSKFEERNRGLAPPVRARLKAFCAEPRAHARFLNMLSLLEHIGSRKIMTCRAMAEADQEMLKHVSEETRHAFFFKRAAERVAVRALDYSAAATIAGTAAKFYMGRLDAQIARDLGPGAPLLAYLYMSLIVELRAVWIYRLYQAVLAEHDCGISLKSVLGEEELHLSAMIARLSDADANFASHLARFLGLEEVRFRKLWSGIEEECGRLRVAAE